MKEHGACAPADVGPRQPHGDMHQAVLHIPVKTACKKLFPVTRSMFLRFAAPAGAGHRRRRAMQDHAVAAVQVSSKGVADAGTLHAVTICSRALGTAAISKGSASLVTELITAPHALIEVLDGCRQSSR